MYKAPEQFTSLIKDLKEDLAEENLSPGYAKLIAQVELGFELLQYLSFEDEPLTTVWVILSKQSLRHNRLQNLCPAQEKAISNAKILLSGYVGRSGWESALRDYIRHIPRDLRLYDFDLNRLDKQFIQGCQTPRSFPERRDDYRACLSEDLPFSKRNKNHIKADQEYDFKAKIQNQPEQTLRLPSFNEAQAKLSQTDLPWFNTEPRARQPLTIAWSDLETVAKWIDTQTNTPRWQEGLARIRYRQADNLQPTVRPDTITFDGFTHLAGIMSSGKSTFMQLIAAYLVYDGRQHPSSSKRRITLVVGDVSSAINLADQFNRWFCQDPETDKPVAVPLLGRSTREKHLCQLQRSQAYAEALKSGRTHWGERFLNPTCPLQGLLPSDKQLLKIGTEPCQGLREKSSTSERASKHPKYHLCPFFAICPAQQLYRDMYEAQIWITTPGGMGNGGLPAQLEERPIKLGDLVYEQSDLVVFDEVDTVMEWFDRLYAQEVKLIAGGQGILDELDSTISTYWSTNRLQEAQTSRWIEAQRRFLTPIGHILALLQRHQVLKSSIVRGYFTARSLFYRVARRLLGLKEYEDERNEAKRRKTEALVNCIMRIFDKLMHAEDPLTIPLPDNARQTRPMTVNTLQRRQRAIEKLSRKDPKRTQAQEASDQAVIYLAYQLSSIMQQTMNTGDSTQNPAIQKRYQDWLTQFVPDLEARLKKLSQTLQNSAEKRDQQYLRDNHVDSLESLALRLEFAINTVLLDRHIKIVFYEWHNRPEVIEGEQPYRRIPSTLRNILPVPPTGRLFGIYQKADQESSKEPATLSTFGYTNVGRHYVTNFHQLRTSLDGNQGPNVLGMSGTSYLPDSTRWHLNIPPKGILKPHENTIKAIQDKNCWFKFMPVYEQDGKPIRISGNLNNKPIAIRQMARELVDTQGGRLKEELQTLEDLWADRARLLLLVNSYEQCEWAASAMKQSWPEEAARIHYLVRPNYNNDDDEIDESLAFQTKLDRVDIELFAQTEGKILIAPLQAIGRGFNILNGQGKAAFGAIYFLTRPMPHPHDSPAIAQELNRRVQDWYDDENFIAWQRDGIYERGLELRRQAGEYWRRVELRQYFAQLRDEKDQQTWPEDEIKLQANPRRDLAATTAGLIIQAVGRLLRGDVPFHAYFVDAAWAPQQAKILKGDDIPLDTPKTSLLAAIIDVMADYVEDPIGDELYRPLFEKLELIENFDWQPIN